MATAKAQTTDDVEPSGSLTASRGIKLVGEAVAPGASLLLDGDVGLGSIYLVGGWIARKAFGPVGWFLVAADSYARSVTGRNLIDNVKGQARGRNPD